MFGVLTGAIRPDAGDVLVAGVTVPDERASMYRNVGVCPQFDCLFELLTPREHMRLFGGVRGLDATALSKHERDVCALLGLDEVLMTRRVSRLSSGLAEAPCCVLVPLLGGLAIPLVGLCCVGREALAES